MSGTLTALHATKSSAGRLYCIPAMEIFHPGNSNMDCVMPRSLNYALAAALLMSTGATAFATAMPAGATAAQKNANHDFGKLSTDGASALRDIRMVRMEIFDGHISRAKTDIAKAVSALTKAQSDETVFTKAESDLKPPAGMQGKMPASSAPSTTAIEWLPVDGAMTLGEDYVATPEKSTGVTKANEKLAKGDRKGAMDELKVADVDVDFLVELAPLKATLAGAQQASDDLNHNKYYEANQALKSVEDGMRFDSQTFVATPQNKAPSSGKSSG